MCIEEPDPLERVKDRQRHGSTCIAHGPDVCGRGSSGSARGSWSPKFRNRVSSLSNPPQAVPARAAPAADPPGDRLKDFVASILGDTEDVWREQFRLMKQTYKEPRLVLFTAKIQSACGAATSAIGPSYLSAG